MKQGRKEVKLILVSGTQAHDKEPTPKNNGVNLVVRVECLNHLLMISLLSAAMGFNGSLEGDIQMTAPSCCGHI